MYVGRIERGLDCMVEKSPSEISTCTNVWGWQNTRVWLIVAELRSDILGMKIEGWNCPSMSCASHFSKFIFEWWTWVCKPVTNRLYKMATFLFLVFGRQWVCCKPTTKVMFYYHWRNNFGLLYGVRGHLGHSRLFWGSSRFNDVFEFEVQAVVANR